MKIEERKAISVGILMKMGDKDRLQVIDSLSEKSRLKLAHLASIGADAELAKVSKYNRVIDQLTRGQ